MGVHILHRWLELRYKGTVVEWPWTPLAMYGQEVEWFEWTRITDVSVLNRNHFEV